MDGARAAPEEADLAYEAVGRMVVAQCDVLIAIWDGEGARGRGGTAQVVAEAARLDLPTLWIHARPPHALQSVAGGSGALQFAEPERVVERLVALLAPPARASEGEHEGRPDLRESYFRERQPHSTLPLGWIWRVVRDLLALRPRRPALKVGDFETGAAGQWAAEWQAVTPPLPPETTARIDTALLRHYAWADGLANYYADLYRSAFVLNYLLGVVAVFLALFGLAAHWSEEEHGREYVKILLTIAVIALILINTEIGKRQRWHERWIDYRLLAESLRLSRFLAPLGRAPAFSRPPAHSAYGDPSNDWTLWHLRAVTRTAGLTNARLDAPYLESCRVLLHRELLGEQVAYHHANAERLARVDHHLRTLGLATFAGVLVVLLVTLARLSGALASGWIGGGWLTLLEAVLPALGGALAAIRGQAELERLVKRSRTMSRQLQRFAAELEAQSPEPTAAGLGRVADAAANAMIAEHLDWRVVFQERSLELP